MSGSWLGVDHMAMAEIASSSESIDSRYIQLLALSARKPDAKPYDKAKMLHATGNYALALKFLHKCANYLRAGKTVNAAVSAAASDAGLPGNKHVARTNPQNRVDSKSVTSANAKFGSSDFKSGGTLHSDKQLRSWAYSSAENQGNICRNWKCFQRAVNLGVIEFKDIKNFGIEGKADAKFYEDNKNFCKERYSDSEECCSYFFDFSYDKDVFEGQIILFPVENYVKLNNLKGYLIEAGEKVNLWTVSEWNDASTPEYY